MDRRTVVEEGNILRVISGPEEGLVARVIGTTYPRGHHREVSIEPWDGVLPTVLVATDTGAAVGAEIEP
jgi:hypothetical protein